jgi:hypothetical protein
LQNSSNTKDAELLYSFPEPASDMATIIRCFTFLNRTAPPTFDEFASCLTKSMKAGIIREEGGKFVVNKDWYDRIHKADTTTENEIEALLIVDPGFRTTR